MQFKHLVWKWGIQLLKIKFLLCMRFLSLYPYIIWNGAHCGCEKTNFVIYSHNKAYFLKDCIVISIFCCENAVTLLVTGNNVIASVNWYPRWEVSSYISPTSLVIFLCCSICRQYLFRCIKPLQMSSLYIACTVFRWPCMYSVQITKVGIHFIGRINYKTSVL